MHDGITNAVAILGGNRIPFARSNGPVRRRVQPGHAHRRARRARRPLRAAGRARSARSSPAPCSSTAATSTSRASACSARALDHATPAYDVQQACDTGLQAALAVADKIALGQIDVRASPAASTPPATPRSRVNEDLRQVLLEANRTKSVAGRLKLLGHLRPGQIVPRDPAQRRAAHRPLDGRAPGASPTGAWGITREDAGRAGRRRATRRSPPPTSAASSTTWSPRTSASSATRTCARTRRRASWQAQARVRRAR